LEVSRGGGSQIEKLGHCKVSGKIPSWKGFITDFKIQLKAYQKRAKGLGGKVRMKKESCRSKGQETPEKKKARGGLTIHTGNSEPGIPFSTLLPKGKRGKIKGTGQEC